MPLYCFHGPAGAVKAYAFDCGDPALVGHRHVDRTNRLAPIDEPLQFSRSLIADGCARTGNKHRGP